MQKSLPVGICATMACLTGLIAIEKDRNSLATLYCASGCLVQIRV